MRCDVLAVGTELLLGQIVDTNSAWIGEQLAAAGLDTYDHRKVGDNQARTMFADRSQNIKKRGGLDFVNIETRLGQVNDAKAPHEFAIVNDQNVQ